MKVSSIGIIDASQPYGIHNYGYCEILKDEELSKLVGMPMVHIRNKYVNDSFLSKNIVFIGKLVKE